MYQLTPQLKNQYKYLNHLKIGSLLFFVEIDLKNIVSHNTLKTFQNLLASRSKVRLSIKREEAHYDKYVENM
jgi:hypothetical protein